MKEKVFMQVNPSNGFFICYLQRFYHYYLQKYLIRTLRQHGVRLVSLEVD